MPSKLVRHGRITGYRPTLHQLREIFELAQGGIDDPAASAHLTYAQGNLEFYPEGELSRIEPRHLEEIIEAAGRPVRLDNLIFSVRQEKPCRSVDILVGPGQWTEYRVESADQTWAHGRYQELTEKILEHRGLYAKAAAPAPQVFTHQPNGLWRPAPQEPIADRRVRAVDVLSKAPGSIGPIVIIVAVIVFLNYLGQGTDVERHHFAETLRAPLPHFLVVCGITLFATYAATIVYYTRWLRSLLNSSIIIKEPSPLGSFSFRDGVSNPVELASFYAICLGIVISLIVPFL